MEDRIQHAVERLRPQVEKRDAQKAQFDAQHERARQIAIAAGRKWAEESADYEQLLKIESSAHVKGDSREIWFATELQRAPWLITAAGEHAHNFFCEFATGAYEAFKEIEARMRESEAK